MNILETQLGGSTFSVGDSPPTKNFMPEGIRSMVGVPSPLRDGES